MHGNLYLYMFEHNLYTFIPNLARFMGMYCLNNNRPFRRIKLSSTAMFLLGI